MNTFKTIHIGTLLIALLCGCGNEKKTIGKDGALSATDPGLHPRLKLDKDTIQVGDSLTGTIGAVFKPSINEKQREELIATLSYRIDTTDTQPMEHAIFYKSRKLNDSTFRFALWPKYEDIKSMQKRFFYASVNVQYYSADNQQEDHTFRQRFEYYVKE